MYFVVGRHIVAKSVQRLMLTKLLSIFFQVKSTAPENTTRRDIKKVFITKNPGEGGQILAGLGVLPICEFIIFFYIFFIFQVRCTAAHFVVRSSPENMTRRDTRKISIKRRILRWEIFHFLLQIEESASQSVSGHFVSRGSPLKT